MLPVYKFKDGLVERFGVLKKLTHFLSEDETVVISENERNNLFNQVLVNKKNRQQRINSMSSPMF